MIASDFALVSRDELWLVSTEPALLERRLTHGVAVQRGREIVAVDDLDAECEEVSGEALADARARVLSSFLRSHPDRTLVRIVATSAKEPDLRTDISCTLTRRGLSVVSDPNHLDGDAELLARFAAREAKQSVDYRGLPVVWRNGSAAVVLHEAAGHPAEHGQPPLVLPAGVRVDAPLAMRRASFTDVPQLRMRHLRVESDSTSLDLPERRLEIHLVSAGFYDTLTETVTIHVAAADLVDGSTTTPVRPFAIIENRHVIASAIRAVAGPRVRYPGVICSREGQELVVPSEAPLLLTEF